MNRIKVEDRLPELRKNVLLLNDHSIRLGYCVEIKSLGEYIFHDGYSCCLDELYDVTHWQPLPEPPTE